LLDDEEDPDPEEALEPEDEFDPEEELDPAEPAGAAAGAGVVELLPLSELVEPGLLSVFDSELLASAGVPLFSDLLPGSFILSE
jgi:hypothetical protein